MPREAAPGRLVPGALAPEFSLLDQHGTRHELDALLSAGPVVVFFYPAAASFGCTRECRAFEGRRAEFAALGACLVGISPDTEVAQAAFAEAESLGYPLLADRDGTVADAYGLRRRHGPVPLRRTTFVIGRDRRIVAVIAHEARFAAHPSEALAALRAIASA